MSNKPIILTGGALLTMSALMFLLSGNKKPVTTSEIQNKNNGDDDFMIGTETEKRKFKSEPTQPPASSKVEGYLQYLLGAAPGLLGAYWATRQNRIAQQPAPNPNSFVTKEDLREVINTIDRALRDMKTANNKEMVEIKDKINEVISKFNEDVKNKKRGGKVKEDIQFFSDMPFRGFTGYSNKELNLLVTKKSHQIGKRITEELKVKPRTFISPVSVHREEERLREIENENDVLNLDISEDLENLLTTEQVIISTSTETRRILDTVLINLNTIINENGRITTGYNELLNNPEFRQQFDTNTLLYLGNLRENMLNEIGDAINNHANGLFRSLITLGEPISIDSQLGIQRDFNLEVSRILQKYYKKILKAKNITQEQKQQILKKFFDDLNKNTYMPAIESISRMIGQFYNKLLNRSVLFSEEENIQAYYRELRDQLLREAQELRQNLSKAEEETEEDKAISMRIIEIEITANKLAHIDINLLKLIAEFNKLQAMLLTGELKEQPKLIEKYRQMLLDPTINGILTEMKKEKVPIIYDLFNI